MASLELLSEDDSGRIFRIGEEAYIGRLEGNTRTSDQFIILTNPDVSRRHACIRRGQEHYLIQDLNSTNGTYVRGKLVKTGGQQRLEDGDEIRIGSSRLLFHDDSEIESGLETDVSADSSDDESGQLSLILLSDDDARPDVSVALDASQIMSMVRVDTKQPEIHTQEALRRFQSMVQVSITLGAETDLNRLMSKILDCIFDIFPSAQRAFILLGDDSESEKLTPVASRSRDPSHHDQKISLSSTIVNKVVREKHSILSSDAIRDARFTGHESIVGLNIRSVMCAPMLIEGEEVLGLIQVDTYSSTHSFNREDLQILTGICAQAAIALKNFRLYEDIEKLFRGFVSASVQAIEARDPTTAGHSFRVARYTERLAKAVDRSDEKSLSNINFQSDQMREIRYAALLHDFGKVGVREHVLTKAKKLHPREMDLVRQRFAYASANLERHAFRSLVDLHEQKNLDIDEFRKQRQRIEEELALEKEKLREFMDLIIKTNDPYVSHTDIPESLALATGYCFPDLDGNMKPLLTDFEFDSLSLSRGSLTPEERIQIESHVSHTYMFLKLIPWTRNLAGVPDIAHAHHEKLDGSGYPMQLHSTDIPIQSKIMTVADIYDALTAGDRPYKSGISEESALDILTLEARKGKIEEVLVQVFIDSGTWRLIQ